MVRPAINLDGPGAPFLLKNEESWGVRRSGLQRSPEVPYNRPPFNQTSCELVPPHLGEFGSFDAT